MANYYVDSSRTGGADTGGSWANAYLTLDQAAAGATDGDRIWVASGHSEGGAASLTIGPFNADRKNPIGIISVDTTGDPEPPTAGDYLRGASFSTDASTYTLTINGTSFFCYGCDFSAGWTLNTGNTPYGTANFRDCSFQQGKRNGADTWTFTIYGAHVSYVDCTYKPGSTTCRMLLSTGAARFQNLAVDNTTATANDLLLCSATWGGRLVFESCDFSQLATSGSLVINMASQNPTPIEFYNCKLPTTGTYFDSAGTMASPDHRIEAYNVDDGNTIYQSHIETSSGIAITQTSVYRDATYDGTNGYAWQLTPTATGISHLIGHTIRFRLASYWAAADETHTIEMFFDSATDLTDVEMWAEFHYPDGTTGSLGKVTTSLPTDLVLSAGTNLTASSLGAGDWTGESGANQKFRKISANLNTLDQAGIHEVWINYAPGATTPVLYVCPHVDHS